MTSNYLDSLLDVSPFSAAVAVIAIGVVIIYWWIWNANLPPGPKGLPYVGYWPFLKQDSSHVQLAELGKKYGDVFSFTVCGNLYISLSSIKAIREAHVAKSECFASRFTEFSLLKLTFDGGVSMINDEPWKVLRKFFIQAFKEHGLTALKNEMAGVVYDIVKSLIDELHAHPGEPFDIIDVLTDKCSTIMRHMMFSEDGISSEELRILNEDYGILLEGMAGSYLLLTGKLAKYVILPLTPRYRKFMAAYNNSSSILEDVIKRRESSFQEDNVRDLIDKFFKERNERRRKNDPTAEYFTNNALKYSVAQFVTDGILTVAYYIGTVIESLVKYPEEQEKIYKELLEVVGADRQPSLNDKSKLPYTNAFLLEVERTTDFFPIFPSLKCTKETTLNGYRIPKESITLTNTWAAHHDPGTFEDPMKFDPSRFITSPGKKRPDLPILFGIGKRSCIGEAFANMQSFMFLTSLVNNFRITLPEGSVSKSSIFLMAGKMKICAHPRNIAKT